MSFSRQQQLHLKLEKFFFLVFSDLYKMKMAHGGGISLEFRRFLMSDIKEREKKKKKTNEKKEMMMKKKNPNEIAFWKIGLKMKRSRTP